MKNIVNHNIIQGNIPRIPYYVAHQLNLYAIEDDLDQTLCVAGKEDNIQLIILTNMMGSNQIVVEILDTRDRVDSFGSLIYTI